MTEGNMANVMEVAWESYGILLQYNEPVVIQITRRPQFIDDVLAGPPDDVSLSVSKLFIGCEDQYRTVTALHDFFDLTANRAS